MPADWLGFITNVSDELASHTIKNNIELAQFIADQYCGATVGKAQSPFGNTHKEGIRQVLVEGFNKGFNELEKNPGPTFAEKENDPEFADLKEDVPITNAGDFNTETEYLKWAGDNTSAPSFMFFQFFEDPSNYPKTAEAAAPLIAKRLILEYDGSSKFIRWIKTLPNGKFGKIGKKVYDEFLKLAKAPVDPKVGDSAEGVTLNGDMVSGTISKALKSGNSYTYYISYKSSKSNYITKEIKEGTLTVPVNLDQIKVKKEGINLHTKIFQFEHADAPDKIPEYLTPSFITKFTYVPSIDVDFGVPGIVSLFDNLLDGKMSLKIKAYGDTSSGEKKKYLDSLQRWVNSQADEAKKGDDPNPAEPTDPYEIMAKAVIDYWKSALIQPLTAIPPVPPCSLTAPLGGTYLPVYYGNQKSLAKFLRRSWNSGKLLKVPGLEKPASKIVATALAVSFAKHLLELKFIYQGGMPSPGGPVPMIGFVPVVF